MSIILSPNRIRALRRLKKMKQAELAREVGIFQSELSEIETGRRKPNIYLAKKIATCLKESLEDIFHRESPDV